jgi:predicted amino acid racemase
MKTPRIELDLAKIHENAKMLTERLSVRGIGVMGVTKVMLGEPQVARALISASIRMIGDSRLENINRMKESGIDACFVLIRSPFKSQAAEVVASTHISFNTELSVIKALSRAAVGQKLTHQIVLMVEMGDLREGVLKRHVADLIGHVINLEGIKLIGLGTNLACFGGVKPDTKNMQALSMLTTDMESKFNIHLGMVSGGNSANFDWLSKTRDVGRINNLRLGEAIFLGIETLHRTPIEGLHLDSITLISEVIESKIKPSLPVGERGENAFGQRDTFIDKGNICRTIVGMGRQDVDVSGLTPIGDFDILGSSSDHVILDSTRTSIKVGDHVRFKLNYSSLLTAMTSTFVKKVFLNLSTSSTC